MSPGVIVLTSTQAAAALACVAIVLSAGCLYVAHLRTRRAEALRVAQHLGADSTRMRSALLSSRRREAEAWDFARRCWRGEFDVLRLEQMASAGRATMTPEVLRLAKQQGQRPF